jgi:TfoX/Sxy family transcriptional regulator of competence genes
MKKFLLVLSVFSLFFACGGGMQKASSGDSAASSVSEAEYRVSEAANYGSRKYIITASLTVRLDDLKNGEIVLNEIMNKYNAYADEISIRGNALYYAVKIPVNNYKQCFEELKIIGKIEYYNERREDVTLNYYDIEGRLATQRELMRKYQQYIGIAANIEEIMAVEKQIVELQHEIDKAGDEFIKLNNSIDFSTVRLTLKGHRNDDIYYTETIGDKIRNLFNRYDNYISTTVSILIGLIIYGIPSLIIILLLYLVLFGKIGILKKIWRLLNENNIRNNK